MSNLTFSLLSQQILNYIDRNDSVTAQTVPFFISQAEQRLSREFESIGSETYVVGNFIAGLAVYQKPGNWRRTLAFNYGTGANNNTRNIVFERSYDAARAYWGDDSQQGLPLYYADYGYSDWLIVPTPNGDYPFEVAYLQLPQQLSINNQSNWYTIYVPDLLFFACMIETSTYLKDFEIVPVWQSYYERALASAKAQNHNRLVDRQSDIVSDKS